MKWLNVLPALIIMTISVVNGQTRCDTVTEHIFVVAEEMPTSNISIDQLEDILNSSIDINKYPRPDGNVIYVSFTINCNGEDFDYKVLRPIDKRLENQLLSIIQSNMTWTPAKQRDRQVDFQKTFEIRIDNGRFNIMDDKEQKSNKKRKK